MRFRLCRSVSGRVPGYVGSITNSNVSTLDRVSAEAMVGVWTRSTRLQSRANGPGGCEDEMANWWPARPAGGGEGRCRHQPTGRAQPLVADSDQVRGRAGEAARHLRPLAELSNADSMSGL